MTILQHPSPNHGARPTGATISAIVLHADGGRTALGTINWITQPVSGVSYHYLIDRSGLVHQFVPDARRAWHAGRSAFDGVPDCNDYALGICFANNQHGEAFPAPQLAAGVAFVAAKCIEYGIPVERITTHAEVALPFGRKADPGPAFPLIDFLSRVQAVLSQAVRP